MLHKSEAKLILRTLIYSKCTLYSVTLSTSKQYSKGTDWLILYIIFASFIPNEREKGPTSPDIKSAEEMFKKLSSKRRRYTCTAK